MYSYIFSLLLLPIIFLNHTAIAHIYSPSLPFPHCSTNNTYAPNSTYDTNLKTLLSWLSSNATHTIQIYNTTIAESNTLSNTIYGLFMCRIGDAVPDCRDCVINSTKVITKLCPMSKEAIIWSDNCFMRYSDHYFFTTVEESPKHCAMNENDYVGQVEHFNSILWDTLNAVRNLTANPSFGTMKYGYKSVDITANQTLYAMGYCIPYLSSENCSLCLSDAIAEIPTSCCKGKTGGRVIYPSCGIRFESYPFYQLPSGSLLTPTPKLGPFASLPFPGKRKHSVTVTAVVVPIILLVVVLCLACSWFLSRRQRKSHEAILKESFGNEVTTLESLWFDLSEIESATNKFAKENMIGKGGFGEVYKGVLSNGKEIAVKRLLRNSQQGAREFKNEVLAIAQLQHRNLVKLQGFCLDGKEKMLVYEYVPNKSLDYFLFDPQKRRELNWCERYKIIGGIARGILYLHEDSRLKIIHRDLKPSNILLDGDMNPKISDFGMARIVAADNIAENTQRIVGTYGYMSPEYVMRGQFSVKSDVFSFGIMLLEIISGKRKGFSSESEHVDGIRKYAQTKWRCETPLELLDPKLEGCYSESEVIKCIQIGLLCVEEDHNDRPTMAKVVSYLNSSSLDLPLPTEQPFFINGKEEEIMSRKMLESATYSHYESRNEMTIEFYPR
ncbi:PREDICTED: cysteine-rich receptor-like protein kinase 25 [Lupinus angustifolius]|uniref:cysteine-rich receptor-like protein kinase 25 n=1 Tax=Lupinus angustifolius TaxID=3871 RepID=UPI00092ECC1F|nr:PREDICTED: cysteine-rich receptor-like protein kinase 25 [Lupinus angustifolius]